MSTSLARAAIGLLVTVAVLAIASYAFAGHIVDSRMVPSEANGSQANLAILLGVSGGYFLWVASWLDHVLAKRGSAPTFAGIMGGALVWGSTTSSATAVFGTIGVLVGLGAVLIAYCTENAIVPDSFEGRERSFWPL